MRLNPRVRLRGRRLVRVHLTGDAPSLEGILLGRTRGHYILAVPKILEATDQTVSLDGQVAIPRERVLFLQILR